MAYETTDVAVEKSQGEIRKLLFAHGAANFSFGEGLVDGVSWAIVEFVHHDQRVRIRVPHKVINQRLLADKIRRAQSRTPDQIKRDLVEQEARRIWRVLFHGLKARLVSVEESVETFEEAFLAHLVDPASDRTLWEQAQGLIESGALKVGGAGMSLGLPAANGNGSAMAFTSRADAEQLLVLVVGDEAKGLSDEQLYKRGLLKSHPDHGGSAHMLAAVQRAGKALGVA